MAKYIVKRVGLIFFTIFIILSLTYILMKKIPRYPPLDPNMDPETYAIIESKYGYNKPVMEQYFLWIKGIVTEWNWGISTEYQIGANTFDILLSKLPATIKVNFVSFLISMPLGFALGILVALRKNKPIDHIVMILVIIFISVPGFVVSTLLMLSADKIGLPTQFAAKDMLTWKHYIIPVAALSFGPIAGLTRYTRAELSEILTSDFLLLARTKGLNKVQSTIRHALRNAMVPLMPIVVGNFVGILSGSLVIESIYGIPGVGEIFKKSLDIKDYNLTMTILAFYTIIGLITTLVVDLSYGIIDPRIRMGAKK